MLGTHSDAESLLAASRTVEPGNPGAVDAVLTHIDEVRRAATDTADAALMAQSWAAEAMTRVRCGALSEAFDAALRAVQALPAGELEARADVEECLGDLFRYQGDDRSAEAAYDRGLRLASGAQRFRMMIGRASVRRRMGRLDEAIADFDAILDEALIPEDAQSHVVAAALLNAASADWQVSRPERALRRLDAAKRWNLPRQERLDAWAGVIRSWVYASMGLGLRAWDDAVEHLTYSGLGQVEIWNSAARLLAALSFGETDSTRPGIAIQMLEVDDMPLRRRVARAAVETALRAAEEGGRAGASRELHRVLADIGAASGDLALELEHRRALDQLRDRIKASAQDLVDRQTAVHLELVRRQAEIDQLKARERGLAEANEVLAHVDARRIRLLRTVAHDLRSPLTALLAVIDTTDPDDPASVRESLGTLDLVSQRMVALLDAALSQDSIHVGETKIERKSVDVSEAIRITVDTFRSLASARALSVEVDVPAGLQASVDVTAIDRIVANLLGNAIKYAPEGGEVRIVGRRIGKMIRLDVLDDGPGFAGIDPAAGLLYGHQLATADRAPEAGWGIGLHTVYQLVSRQGGMVELGNRPDGGAHVRVRLPVS